MIPKTYKRNAQRPGRSGQDLSWPDLEQLARRVIRAANLAVMAHAELESVSRAKCTGTGSRRKAG